MRSYWCYLLDAKLRVASAQIVECADDGEAKRKGRAMLATSDDLHAVEIWDSTRRIYGYPGEELTAAEGNGQPRPRDRKSAKIIRDAVLAARREAADKLAVTIAEDRRQKVQAEAAKTARLRELRLASRAPAVRSARTTPIATILLVEDDAAFAYALSKSLRDADHHVITALDGMSALKTLDTDARVDLLLTDIVLPTRQPHGLALARMARQKRPGLAVIYMTGYDDLGKDVDGDRILLKPFEPQTVLDEIDARLRSALV
jgi:CheY-like chemotaxis protein